MGRCDMGELQAPSYIAHRIDAPVGHRAQIGPHGDAGPAVGDAARLKVQPLNRGLAPGGDQKMRAGQHKPVGQPPITRWDYREFSVYFEYDHVINSVRHHQPRHLDTAKE
jgi:hypothetical protein